MFRPSKRQRRQQNHPTCWLECETLTAVPTLSSVVRTKPASAHMEELFLDRFEKEIGCHFALTRATDEEGAKKEGERKFLKQRILVGTKACTKALQASPKTNKPSLLVVLIATEHQYALPWVHIPVLANRQDIPLLLLSSAASKALTRMLRARSVTVMAFLPEDATANEEIEAAAANAVDGRKLHKSLNSFVDFIVKKVGLQNVEKASKTEANSPFLNPRQD